MNRRRAWILVLAILIVGGGLAGWRISKGRNKKVQYRTGVVERGDVNVQVSATGTLEAVTTVQVGSQVSGTIAALYADFNDQVKEGQVLAQLDPTFLRAQVAQNVADLERAQVQVNQAKRDSARVFSLGAQGLSSQSELDAAKTALDAARASESSAQAALDRARTNLRYATISSPISGVVISRNVDVGQTVAASLQAPTLFTIANDLTQMQLQAAVDEADIGQIRTGQGASFTVDAYPDLTFKGTVSQIRLSPETLQNVVTYTVIILVENPEQKLLPGMTANVTVLVAQEKDALKVPSMALRVRLPESRGAGSGSAPRAGDGASAAVPREGASAGSAASSAPAVSRASNGGPAGAGSQRGMGGAGGEAAHQGNRSGGQSPERGQATVYILQNEHPRPVPVRPGLSDGTFTAIHSDSLSEGMTVVLAVEGIANRAADQQVVNPFAPRMPGGGGGGRGRR